MQFHPLVLQTINVP